MIGKSGAATLESITSWRQIIVGPALQKWYLHCIFELVEPYMNYWPSYIMGFRPGFQPLMMIDALRMALYKTLNGDVLFVCVVQMSKQLFNPWTMLT